MKITEEEVQQMVQQVLNKMTSQNGPMKTTSSISSISLGNGVFSTVDEAFKASKKAMEEMSKMSLCKRKKMIAKMREMAKKHAEELAQLAVEETGLGRVEDKTAKNLLASNKTPGVEDLVSESFTGDNGMTLVEYAPMGIVGSITPTTNPAATVINNSISLVAAGNVVIYNPHPSAKQVSLKTMQLLNDAITSVGGPKNTLVSVSEPTIQTSEEIMKHPHIKYLLVTGGGAVVKAAMSTGKKVIAAGPGNPPVVVDETADIEKAAKDIVFGASFDNNVLCTAEKEVFVVDSVANKLKQAMIKNKAIELKGFQLEKLLKVIMEEKDGKYRPNKDFVGKDATYLLNEAGINAASDTRLIITETSKDHPLVNVEMLMPILPIVKVPNVEAAIENAVKAEKGNHHTAMMHSQNMNNVTKMAQAIQATIFVNNGSSLAGLGYKGEGFTTLTIAGPTGEGLTSAKTFTRQRRFVSVDGLRII